MGSSESFPRYEVEDSASSPTSSAHSVQSAPLPYSTHTANRSPPSIPSPPALHGVKKPKVPGSFFLSTDREEEYKRQVTRAK